MSSVSRDKLKTAFLEGIAYGLSRRALISPSRWAEKYRVIHGGPWRFRDFPWLRGMHDSKAQINVAQKGAQLGVSETLLNLTYYFIDVRSTDCLYVLPSKTPDASEFTAGRFNPALESSPYLANLFSSVSNVGHKRAGTINLYVRGSKSRSGLMSIPVGFLVLDEVDEMVQRNIPLAFARLSGHEEKFGWLASTPTFDGRGINGYFKKSTQNNYFFRCPSCDRFIDFRFPESMEVVGESSVDPRVNESFLKCYQCHSKIHHENKSRIFETAEWIPTYSQRSIVGWHISQFYSTKITPKELAQEYLESLYDPMLEQIFYNSRLGETREVEGARLTDIQIDKAILPADEIDTIDSSLLSTSLGIDVGHPWIHYVVAGYPDNESVLILDYGKIQNFEDLDTLMYQYKINFAVIDAHPERRKAFEFSQRFPNFVRLCFYAQGIQGRSFVLNDSTPEPTVSVDRTSWIDLAMSRFRSESISIPPPDNEFRDHFKNPVRIYEKDRDGNLTSRYVADNLPDHYLHAFVYSEIAHEIADSGIPSSQTIGRSVL